MAFTSTDPDRSAACSSDDVCRPEGGAGSLETTGAAIGAIVVVGVALTVRHMLR